MTVTADNMPDGRLAIMIRSNTDLNLKVFMDLWRPQDKVEIECWNHGDHFGSELSKAEALWLAKEINDYFGEHA